MRLGMAVLCLFPVMAAAQDEALARLQAEAVKLRTEKITEDTFDKSMARLRSAQRDWIESKLLKSRTEFLDRADHLGQELDRDLKAAKITPDDAPKKDDDPEGVGFGYVGVTVRRLPELPDMAFVTASATIPCGAEDSVYAYKFDASRWRRVIDARSQGMGDVELKLSEPDSSGQRLVLTHWQSQQCSSSWMEMTYKVFRLDWDNGVAQPVLTENRSFWLDARGPLFVLSPTEMTVEFSDSSVDGAVHHRTRIERNLFAPAAQRIDPVALQPQDFAEEWLTRPWNEMESRSATATRALHESFGGFVGGEYVEMTQCSPEQPVWLAGLDIEFLGDKQLKEPRRVYLQLRDLGDRRYRMESASSVRPTSCKAEPGHPNENYPWLSEEEIRKLK
jgi:hypothetical protein